MMFRYGKIIESNAKTSRSDRFAEMSKQQQLIESKKQEIKAKFEERKRQEANEASKLLNNKSLSDRKNNKDRKLLSSRIQSWKNDERWRKKSTNDQTESLSQTNFFSNDGSFLEKYKQMTTDKCSDDSNSDKLEYSDSKTISQSAVKEDDSNMFSSNIENNHNNGTHFATSDASHGQSYSLISHPSASVQSTPSTFLSSNTLTSLTTVPASLPLLTAMPPSNTALQTVSLVQVPVSVPASSVIFSCPLETTLVASEPVVHFPVVHSTLTPSSVSLPLQTIPLQTTVIPTQIQITSSASESTTSMQAVQIDPSSTKIIVSQTSQSVFVSSEDVQSTQTLIDSSCTNVQPLSVQLLSSVPSVIPNTSALSSMQVITSQCSTVTPITEKCDARDFTSNCESFRSSTKTSSSFHKKSIISELEDRNQKFHDLSCNKTSNDERSINDMEKMENFAQLVAKHGDDYEKTLLQKYPNDENIWFLNDKLSPDYVKFRSLVVELRQENEKNRSHTQALPKSLFEEQKISNKNFSSDEDDNKSQNTERIKRRRKRKSRWAPEDMKEKILPVPLNAVGSVLDPGVVVPTAVKNISAPVQNCQTKFSGPMISQVNRSDPALLQYALKSFGTLNLSEEDWKKAEDHYKINLLYQDMLKKRQELERLQAAGKHKYAYDSDEDTEGGTWEHKLRQQEMVATQLWADELTERAKGKHHIGDFLPPDELERFLEKYNALKQGREPDLSDYKEFKLKEDNIGFQMLQKSGWVEGQGLGPDGSGIVNPVNKGSTYAVSHGLGMEKPDDVSGTDDEYEAYRKRMMLAYRFRPNPLNNPRRPYY